MSRPREPVEFSLIEVANAVLRHWRLVVILPVAFAAGAGLSSLGSERPYVATAAFVPETPGRGGVGAAQVGGLARQLGISVSGQPSAQSSEFYADLLRSRGILREVVETEYEVTDEGGGTRRSTLMDLYAANGAADRAAGPSVDWRRAVERLQRRSSVSVSRETGVIQLRVRDARPELAEQVAARLLQLVEEFNLERRQTQAGAETRWIAERLEESQGQLLEAEGALQAFLRQNRQFAVSPEGALASERLQRQAMMAQQAATGYRRIVPGQIAGGQVSPGQIAAGQIAAGQGAGIAGFPRESLMPQGAVPDLVAEAERLRRQAPARPPASPELVFEHDRLQRQVLMRQQVHLSLVEAYEQARLDARRDTPLITVIDHPAGSAVQRPRTLVRSITLGFLLGLMIALSITFMREYVRRSRSGPDDHYREFHELREELWHDLRSPRRWVPLRRSRRLEGAGVS